MKKTNSARQGKFLLNQVIDYRLFAYELLTYFLFGKV